MNIKSVEINGKPTFESIMSNEIVVIPKFQRDVEARKTQFNKIMREFSPALVNPIKVAEKDGKYICVDGQMTRKVLIARNNGEHLPVMCKVYHGLSDDEIAFLFINQNGITSSVKVADKIRVGYENGSELETAFVRETEKNGLTVSFAGYQATNTIVAVNAAWDCFLKFNNCDKYGRFIRIIKSAWNGNPQSVRGEILKGLCIFMKHYEGQYSESVLINHLMFTKPEDIIRDGNADRSGGARKYAVKILEVYNYRLNQNNRLPNTL